MIVSQSETITVDPRNGHHVLRRKGQLVVSTILAIPQSKIIGVPVEFEKTLPDGTVVCIAPDVR